MTQTTTVETLWHIMEHLLKVGNHRRPAFLYFVDHIFQIGHAPLIVETGTLRQLNNYEGDGQSSLLWDLLIQYNRGHFVSIDIDAEATKTARGICKGGEFHTCESVSFLHSYPEAKEIDILYLDSMDFDGTPQSAHHHMKELAAIYDRLPSGCLIAVDDCHRPEAGKHVEVKKFFDVRGIDPVLQSYIHIWVKP